jgi:hypothetical protein
MRIATLRSVLILFAALAPQMTLPGLKIVDTGWRLTLGRSRKAAFFSGIAYCKDCFSL